MTRHILFISFLFLNFGIIFSEDFDPEYFPLNEAPFLSENEKDLIKSTFLKYKKAFELSDLKLLKDVFSKEYYEKSGGNKKWPPIFKSLNNPKNDKYKKDIKIIVSSLSNHYEDEYLAQYYYGDSPNETAIWFVIHRSGKIVNYIHE